MFLAGPSVFSIQLANEQFLEPTGPDPSFASTEASTDSSNLPGNSVPFDPPVSNAEKYDEGPSKHSSQDDINDQKTTKFIKNGENLDKIDSTTHMPLSDVFQLVHDSEGDSASTMKTETQSESVSKNKSKALENESSDVPEIPLLKGEEEPIPSFLEWTHQQQQKQESTNQNNGGKGARGQYENYQQPKKDAKTVVATNDSGTPIPKAPVKQKEDKVVETASKNFASPDCGAKVIQTNAEAQNPSGVLSSSHDEYMLNK